VPTSEELGSLPFTAGCAILGGMAQITNYGSRNLPGQCLTCGFFAKYAAYEALSRVPGPYWYEVETTQRLLGRAFKHTPHPSVGEIDTVPECFLGNINFMGLIAGKIRSGDSTARTGMSPAEIALVELWSPGKVGCKKWYPYTAGKGPEKHLEEFKMRQLERQNHFWVLVVAALAAIQAIFAFLAWLGPRHSPPPPTVIVNPSIIINPAIEVPVTVTPLPVPDTPTPELSSTPK